MKKLLLSILVFLLIFSLPFLHLMGNKNVWYWNSGDISHKEEIIDNTYNFIQLNSELKYFDQDVKNHLYDVRTIYWYSLISFIVILILSLLSSIFLSKKDIITAVKNSCKAIIVVWLVFSVWTIVSFNSFFLLFHKIFFSENYIFSYNNLIIQLFPQVFFENLGIIIGFSEIVFASMIIYLLKD